MRKRTLHLLLPPPERIETKTKSQAGEIAGKGRFGKRALSVSLDQPGHSTDSNSNSNDSGIDFNSYESQMSWGSEDAQFGRTLSNLSTVSNPPRFPTYGKKELCQNLVKEDSQLDSSLSNEGPVVNLLDISATRLMLPEKAQIVPPSVRMSPDSSDQVVVPNQAPIMVPGNGGSQSPNGSSPTSSTLSPIPMKRPRFSYIPPQAGGKGTGGLRIRNQNQAARSIGKRLPPGTAPTLSSILSSVSRDGTVQLQIISQPEEQHRARYQTEGSRGAIKDRKGNGFPTVKLVGYDKPATLQIFIGTDQGKVSPHMFYQACKVTGKSSTPCIEKKVEGTIVIEIEFEPSKDMVISCDCVGILKERNVDVEQRFPFHHAAQSRKKSTKCRMVFRTTIINGQGMEETLQLSSSPILCTQPPGHPEICKQSTYECLAKGGHELFVIGKNFLKDTRVLFQEEDTEEQILWESVSEPLKDYLQQNHLICVIPPYKSQGILSPVECKVTIVSGGKQSEPQRFCYIPNMATAPFGIPSPSSTVVTSATNSIMAQQEVLSPPITHNQMPMSLTMSNQGPMIQSSEDSNMGPMNGGTSPQNTMSLPTSPTRTNLAPLQFPENMHVQSAQERQVVSELQSILDQSVQQRNDGPMSGMITIKHEGQGFPGMHQTPITAATVPLDLQFPNAVVPVTSVDSSNSSVLPTQQQMSFTEANPQPFVQTATQMNGMMSPPVPILTRQGSVEMVSVEHQMLNGLMPTSQGTMSSSNMNGVVSTTGSNAIMAVTSAGMCQVGEMIKMEPQGSSVGATAASTMPITNVVSSAQPQPSLAPGQSYMGNELQAHSGAIATALTQMSENELMNYINPSCFEQNVPLI